ncbi:MAG: hypothetical protein QOI78_1587 [Actinomycetota bacterium]|nr:hypothetical protein [Actinomycetota bacterium]
MIRSAPIVSRLHRRYLGLEMPMGVTKRHPDTSPGYKVCLSTF